MKSNLKCYMGKSRNCEEFSYHAVCFAENSKQAKTLMWNYSELRESCNGEYLDASSVRYKEGDQHLDKTKTEPYVVSDSKTLRNFNWRVDGDSSCDTCGLYEMDGAFPVCEGCCQCNECKCSCKD